LRDKTKKEVYSWIKSILFALTIAFIFRQFLFSPVTVQGESMMPTFEDNNRLVVSKISEIDHFDIIVFHSPVSEKDFIKRVIGLPGDTIEMNNDQLFINGEVYQESYLSQNRKIAKEEGMKKLTGDFGPITIPEDKYFVMGDNRLNSSDSREFGFISNTSVVGEVGFRFYPLNEIGNPNSFN
jgi:signal peptidase I